MAQWARARAGDALRPSRVALSRWQAIAVCRQALPIRSGVELEIEVGERLGVARARPLRWVAPGARALRHPGGNWFF